MWRSHGRDNDELVNTLRGNDIVKTDGIATAMKAVDRAHYVRCASPPCPPRPRSRKANARSHRFARLFSFPSDLPSASDKRNAYVDSPQSISHAATIR